MYLISCPLQRQWCPLRNVAPCLHHTETTAYEKMEERLITPNLDVCGREDWVSMSLMTRNRHRIHNRDNRIDDAYSCVYISPFFRGCFCHQTRLGPSSLFCEMPFLKTFEELPSRMCGILQYQPHGSSVKYLNRTVWSYSPYSLGPWYFGRFSVDIWERRNGVECLLQMVTEMDSYHKVRIQCTETSVAQSEIHWSMERIFHPRVPH